MNEIDKSNDIYHSLIHKYIKNNEFVCDICQSNINKKNNIGFYVSDVMICEKERTNLKIDIMFCDECNPYEIRIPHLGVNELNLLVVLENETNNIKIKNIYEVQRSVETEGIVWNPDKLWFKITGHSLSTMIESPSVGFVSEFLYQAGIPLQSILKDDGKINFQGHSKKSLRNKYIKYVDNNY